MERSRFEGLEHSGPPSSPAPSSWRRETLGRTANRVFSCMLTLLKKVFGEKGHARKGRSFGRKAEFSGAEMELWDPGVLSVLEPGPSWGC